MCIRDRGFGFEKGVGDELQKKMIGLEQYPAYCMIILNAHADLMLHALETGDPYPIKMGFYAGNNLMSCTSMEPQRWHDAVSYTHLDVYKRQALGGGAVSLFIALDAGEQVHGRHTEGIGYPEELVDADVADAVLYFREVPLVDVRHEGCLLYTSRCV